jgi:uncharacterized protein (TIGR03000 family)
MIRIGISCVRFATLAIALVALAIAPIPAFAGGPHGGGGGGGYHGGGGYGGGYHGGYGGYHGGYGYYGGYGIGIGLYPGWGYGYGYGWGYPLYYSSGVIAADSGYYAAPAPQSPPPQPYTGPQPSPGATTAAVEVRVPADAQVWFDDLQTKQSGEVRLFETPALDNNKVAHYAVRAKWTIDGRDVEQTRQINVQAGRRTLVDFLRPEAEVLPSPKD